MRRLHIALAALAALAACDDPADAPRDARPPAPDAAADADPAADAEPDAGTDADPPDAAPPAPLRPARATGGPAVVFAPDARPLPDIPLPNDALTRKDPGALTGRRVAIPLDAATAHENATRAAFNEMDGFGAFAPIFVSFDAPLDLDDILARHRANDDFRDDALYLLNVDPDCRRYGEEVALDIGRRRYPATIYRHSRRVPDPEAPDGYRLDERSNAYFRFDPMGEANSLLFPERDEDTDGDGILDPGEDRDGDGVLDLANLHPRGACDAHPPGTDFDRCVADHLLTWYERQTHTLILRPLWPLEQQCTYAVVLTHRLRGEDTRPVASPLEGINLAAQSDDLRPVLELIARYDLGPDDIAFTWSFTVGSMTRDLEALRAGLYGHGPFARLATGFPPERLRLWSRGELGGARGDDRPLVPGACAGAGLTYLWQHGIGEWDPNMCALEADFSTVGGIFGGTFEAPYLLTDSDGIATERYPADDDERWQLDPITGEARIGTATVPFWCALPIERAVCPPGNPDGVPFCKPFPTVVFTHGYGSSRAEITSHLGRHTAMGTAVCALDAPGHGLDRWLADPRAGAALLGARVGFTRYGVPALAEMLARGRDRDLDNDGLPDGGADQWTADLFHTRDMVRQSALEVMQLVRILRAMDGREGPQGILGDVDGDGEVDLAGPLTTLGLWGISLGGITAGVLAGAEPSLDAVSPNAGGAGLVDIAMRSSLGGLPDAIILPMIGPIIAGCLPVDAHDNPLPPAAETTDDCLGTGLDESITGDTLRVGAYVTVLARQRTLPIGALTGVRPGDRVRLHNRRTGAEATTLINARGHFRLAVAADALGAVERRPIVGIEPGRGAVAFEDTPRLGDPLELTVYVGDSDTVRGVLDRFGRDVEHFATRYPEGAPLVALAPGLGLGRNTPDFRRFAGIAQHAVSPADPGVWAAHVIEEPLDFGYDPHRPTGNTRVLMMPVAGDRVVPVNTGVAMARAAGLLGSWRRDPDRVGPEHGWRELFVPDPRYGTSIDQALADRHVIEGDHRLQRHADNPINPNVMYDIDDLSDGTAAWSCGPSDWSGGNGEHECPDAVAGQEVFFGVPHPAPGDALRVDRPRDGRVDGFRVPVVRPAGQHGIYNAQPFRVFDHDAYTVNLTARFLATGGRVLGHEPGCDCTADRLPAFTRAGAPIYPSFDRACGPDELKLCDPVCAAAWGIVVPEEAPCEE